MRRAVKDLQPGEVIIGRDKQQHTIVRVQPCLTFYGFHVYRYTLWYDELATDGRGAHGEGWNAHEQVTIINNRRSHDCSRLRRLWSQLHTVYVQRSGAVVRDRLRLLRTSARRLPRGRLHPRRPVRSAHRARRGARAASPTTMS